MPPASGTFTTKALKDGAHNFTAKAAIGGEVSGFTAAFKTIIDRKAPPQPTIDLDTASDTGASSTDAITSDATLTLTGNAEAGSRIVLSDGATVVGVATATAAGKWTLTTAALADGVHNLTATAADRAGNVSPVSLTRTVTIDTTAPAAPSTPDLAAASDSGFSDTDNLTNDATPLLTGTAEAGSTVTIRDGATVLGTATADGAGQWSFTTGALSQGVHSITATATDQAGNISPQSPPLAVTIDTPAPAPPTIDSYGGDVGTTGDGRTTDTTLHLTGTTEANGTVEIFDGANSLGTAVADGAGAWTFDTAALGLGEHSFTARAEDGAGNASDSSPLAVIVETRIVYDLTFLGPSFGFIVQGDLSMVWLATA